MANFFIGLGFLLIGWWDITRWSICKDVYWFHDKINIIHAVMMAMYVPLSIPLIFIIPHFFLLHKQEIIKTIEIPITIFNILLTAIINYDKVDIINNILKYIVK